MSVSKTTLQNLMPVGSGMYAPANSLGTDWLLCDGTAYLISVYPELSGVLGTAYNVGTEAAQGKFAVPNAVDRVLVGLDNYGTAMGAAGRNPSPNASTVGKTGGATSVLLDWQNFPNHSHSVGSSSHNHSFSSQSHNHGGGHARAAATTVYQKDGGTAGHTTVVAIDNGPAGDGWSASSYSFVTADYYPATAESSGYAHNPAGTTTPPSHENRQPHATLFLYVKAK